MKRKFLPLAAVLLSLAAHLSAADLTLWYQQPAADNKPMNEALPLGNGRFGALLFGGPTRDRLCLNEDSLWTGGTNASGDYESMGAYQVLGNIYVNLPGSAAATGYRRFLELGHALAGVNYAAGGENFRREYFCSHPAGVLVAEYVAGHPGQYTGSVELADGHAGKITVADNRFTVTGTLDNGLKYEWQVLVQHTGGTVAPVKDTNGVTRLEFKGCDTLELLAAAGTDYVMDYAKQYHGEDPHARVTAAIDSAAPRGFSALINEHVKDFGQLFNRVTATFGDATPAQVALPTDQRKLAAFKQADPGLEALLFQFGRYLMISCSRPGGLPANLQGLWNDNNTPPWHSDYHADINIQMNYWPAETANLGECHTPFFDLVTSQLPAWRAATAADKAFELPDGQPARGFAIRCSHNITGGMGWQWDKTANAWYCQHFWEHFAFGRDTNYLRTVAYPVLKETCQFWEDHLKALPDGRLVVPNGWSPEHGPTEDGVSYNQEIVWDLFNNYVQAADTLGADASYRAKIAGLRDRLVVPKIGKWGQLQEWMTDRDDPNDHHRHTSHLFAVYPGRQISPAQTPDLAKAAKISLDARGIYSNSDVREWSFAWRTALYARLHDAESAHRMVQNLFSARNTCLNLFGLHPPMQMDGNFGVTAGIAEMLVQSQTGTIELLPALPAAWATGKVTGLRARGGYEVDLAWKDGKLTSATVKNVNGTGPVPLSYGSKKISLNLPPGEVKTLGADWQ